MLIDKDVIRQAFQLNDEIYAQGKDWTVRAIAKPWKLGQLAYSGTGNPAASHDLYDTLKNYWQVFRPQSTAPAKEHVYELMLGLARKCAPIRDIRLSKLSPEHVPQLKKVLQKASKIKKNKGGPSLVAASKFLHFWNPRLFVIVDGNVMENHVLSRHWIRGEIEAARAGFKQESPAASDLRVLQPGGDIPYLWILLWASQVMQKNPSILATFTERLEKVLSPHPDLRSFEDFEGAAFEWLLRGLVELPPAGVHLT